MLSSSSLFRIPLCVAGVYVVLLGGCDWGGNQTQEFPRRDSVYENSIGMSFQFIPKGRFDMGSVTGERDEKPVREVEITEPFFLGSTEVTQEQWESVMSQNPSTFEGPYNPVESVSWRGAQAFIDSLNRIENTDLYRLPTEAEWEYAARGGTTTRYYFGETRDSMRYHAWYSFNSDRQTHRVGRRHANPFGLHDVYGNVWEWVGDAYDPAFYDGASAVDPFHGGSSREPRVIRGGGWFGVNSDLRSANRAWAQPTVTSSHLGFRVLREIPDDQQ